MGHIERGNQNISLTKIYQLAEALDISVSNLFGAPSAAEKENVI